MHFFLLLIKKKIFKAIKGKNKICWINSDEYGISFYGTLMFYNKFLTQENCNFGNDLTKNFESCTLKDLTRKLQIFRVRSISYFIN